MDVLPIGSGKDVLFSGMTNRATGAAINDGTATWEVWTATLAGATYSPGEAVAGASGSLAYVAASDGDYRGTIPDTVTADLTAEARYFVRGEFTSGGSADVRWLLVVARRRGER